MDNIVSLYLLALSMCIYMENLELLAAKMSELLHVLCFAGIWTLLGLACDWSEFGQKKSNIFTNGQYELPCKVSSL